MGAGGGHPPVLDEQHLVGLGEQQRRGGGHDRRTAGACRTEPPREEGLGVRVQREGGLHGQQHLGLGQ
ncbi:hypothetical protein [Streptosporangium canum]|uniref:hypothetical protein n=1 Tax=Streptosporangium canum TaxID=324952 RepID=UPI0033BA2FC7